jgi:hypothetical protein
MNKNVIRDMVAHDNFLSKLNNAPVIDRYFAFTRANSRLLFEKLQTWLKVNDAQVKLNEWQGKHPEASEREVVLASRSISKQVNAAYGGLNWTQMGVTPTVKGVLRLFMLAPDWTLSNFALGKYAMGIGEAKIAGSTSPAAFSSRSHVATAALVGAFALEGMNKAITGHYTNENDKGKEFQVEVRPGVYFNPFRGGIGDMMKLAINIKDQGVIGGFLKTAAGKGSPFLRTAAEQWENTDYRGRRIAGPKDKYKDLKRAAHLLQNAGPIPLGIGSTVRMAHQGNIDPLGMLLTLTGVAQTGKPGMKHEKGDPFADALHDPFENALQPTGTP